jgi:O-antigen ligase
LRGEAAIGLFDILMVGLAVLSLLISLKPAQLTAYRGEYDNHALATLVGRWRHNPAAVFWLLTIPVFAVSILVNLQGGRLQDSDVFRSTAPFAATAIVSLAAADLYLSQSRKAFLLGFIISTFVLSIIYTASILIGFIDLYNIDGRFIGWSANPNQTGFVALAALIVCVISYNSDFRSNRLIQIAIVITILCSVIIGRASQSDSFTLSMAPLLAFSGLKAAEAFTGNKATAIVLLIFGALLAVVAIFALQPEAVASAINRFVFDLQYGNQDVDRITAWTNGVRAWQESPILGHGPGGWSGFSGPFEGVEAHNSYIDWLTIVGLTGFVMYILFLLTIFKFSLFTDTFRYVALVAILIFGAFNFLMRFPIYWIAIMVLVLEVNGARDSSWFERARRLVTPH